MSCVYIGLGSNLGDRAKIIQQAIEEIEKRIGATVALSALFETAPWGYDSPHPFLNAALAVETTLSPLAVLEETQSIEQELGRTHKSQGGIYHDRPIDIDLLLWDNLILDHPRLTLPHPLMHLRPFVLLPLAQIAPQVIHPLLHQSIQSLAAAVREER